MLDQITHLFRLQAIFEEGSLRSAANRLNITQPALSRSLAQLERYFGHPLLERHARGVRPTPFGERVLSEALRMQRQWQLAEQSLRHDPALGQTRLRIGAGPVWRASVVPGFLLALEKDFPDIEFELRNTRFSQAIGDLKEGRLDVIFTGSPMLEAEEQRLVSRPFAQVTDHVVARDGHPIFDHAGPDGQIPTERLLDYPWVVYSEIPAYHETARNGLYQLLRQEPRITIQCESLLSTLTVLQRSDHLSILPDATMAAFLGAELRPVRTGLRERGVRANMIYREEMQNWPPLAALIALATGEASAPE
ncbi:LysR family transcriptional regulator [Pseudooceanicola sp. CBS1P-1]|uniref:LysR family transcriptional regulator n=1 Tax=Pseudooceanicola albus TaxID=2692189 RepID=A0A6L7G030_9RHOB|nr:MULTISPECIES: LysR family transcriptional regulator [Pseudooceanicola]MBT9382306.1 LysR family transcriptional regulator [Pseudooceanicola endophyticus]MXN16848.1 LysR family transcriptional regulator [Pseudooceanicola albus]